MIHYVLPIQKHIKKLDLSVFPNPNYSGRFTINNLELTSYDNIKLYDCTGKLIPLERQNNTIFMKQTKAGLYILNVITENGVFYSAKIILL